MARLLLIRHAPTAETGKYLTGRTPGVPLHPEGKTIASAVGAALTSTSLDAVYTSPILRCRQTAKAVGDAQSLVPINVTGLAEVDYGQWAGRTLKSLSRTKLWRELFVAPSRVRFPDGETLREVQVRAVGACEELALRHPRGTIAIVSHGDVLKSILAHYLGTPLDLFQRIHVGAASLSIVDVPTHGHPSVLAMNRIVHEGGN